MEYKGFTIARMSNGETWYYEPGEPYYVTPDVPTAKGEIDAMLDEPKEYTGRGHGGYIYGPPEWCKRRVQFDGEPGYWWADAILCHGSCKENHHCPVFTEFMAGQRDRIKLMNTEKAGPECPHCKSPLQVEYPNHTAVYGCGTIYSRISSDYKQHCPVKGKKKEPEAEQPPRRRRTT
jgi:hypothetical protein